LETPEAIRFAQRSGYSTIFQVEVQIAISGIHLDRLIFVEFALETALAGS
jgi:hypothetical protein